MKYFATFFDINYLSRGLVLYHSLVKVEPNFILYILCLDNEVLEFLNKNKFKYIYPICISELEKYDKELYTSKSNKTPIEYYFTISPCLPIFLLRKFNISHICTLDADICFYKSPDELFLNLNSFSIIITPHKFAEELKHFEIYGKYNVSFQIFKNDLAGNKCLERWRIQCLDWCKDEIDENGGRFADQKYLDTWVSDYSDSVKVLDDNISGIAPWNLNRFKLTSFKNSFYVDNTPIIYFHFQFFKIIYPSIAINGFIHYRVDHNTSIKSLYLKYWNDIEIQNKYIGNFKNGSIRGVRSLKKIEKIFQESTFFFKVFNNIYAFNAQVCPGIIRRVLIKILS